MNPFWNALGAMKGLVYFLSAPQVTKGVAISIVSSVSSSHLWTGADTRSASFRIFVEFFLTSAEVLHEKKMCEPWHATGVWLFICCHSNYRAFLWQQNSYWKAMVFLSIVRNEVHNTWAPPNFSPHISHMSSVLPTTKDVLYIHINEFENTETLKSIAVILCPFNVQSPWIYYTERHNIYLENILHTLLIILFSWMA